MAFDSLSEAERYLRAEYGFSKQLATAFVSAVRRLPPSRAPSLGEMLRHDQHATRARRRFDAIEVNHRG